ncbi:DNA cytosine methyltransferase [Nostoc sp. FACHB-87]|uniref:DNA cytosine methyltransferase n=1 Tax=Nostocaceae TaxID=1162 RepID=UPI00168866AF|nr:DNA cytosine methyltransferase [Nostoc sp. FACHB-87]MBD2479846.1 DNA cytosine methyltransferase [Anabaena sp. FACHB-83]
MLTQLDLCSGVGAGFCLAGLQLGFELIGVAEIDEYCCDILAKRYPGVHNYGDVRDMPRLAERRLASNRIDLLTASPPCPPFSTEGQRLGGADERDCFPAVLKIIEELQPKFAAIENVPGLITCPDYPGQPAGSYFRGVVRTLDSIGYDAEWLTISSGHFASPFIRERVLLVAIARSVVIDWQRATPWSDQARSRTEEIRAFEQRRGVKPGYPLRVVQNPSNLARPLGIKSRDGIIRSQRAAAGNLLDPRVATVALQRIIYLNSLCR